MRKDERPILMSGPMVAATLRTVGPKTQTRRIVKGIDECPHGYDAVKRVIAQDDYHLFTLASGDHRIKCPYGYAGDRLWVKETHYRMGRWVRSGTTKTGRPRWRFRAEPNSILFVDQVEKSRAPIALPKKRTDRGWHKRPSIFMPKGLQRINLEVLSVRVERLHDISQQDVDAEGTPSKYPSGAEVADFRRLWETINGAGSWRANPWVWVVEFRRIAAAEMRRAA